MFYRRRGVLRSAGRREALAGASVALLRGEARRRRYAAAARAVAIHPYGRPAFAERRHALYEELLDPEHGANNTNPVAE